LEYTTLTGSVACYTSGDTTGKLNAGGEFWLFFTIRSVPDGTYTADVQQTPSGSSTPADFSTSSTPFKLASNGKSIHVIYGSALDQCPSSVPDNTGFSNSEPVTFSPSGGPQDVQIGLHIVAANPSDLTPYPVTFTATLYNGTGTGGSVEASAVAITVSNPCPA
jgi:hypothetical protein